MGKSMLVTSRFFTIKYKVGETIEQYKTRLMTKGLKQTYGVYYNETCYKKKDHTKTFAPMTKLNIVRVLLSLVSKLGLATTPTEHKKIHL